jgi:hypothetical protein
MDSVRFGRVLGIGARLAGKTIVQAVDAAASPNPRATATTPPGETVTVLPPPVARAAASAKATSQGVARGSKKFGEAVWSPMVRSGKVLWLEVTGVFFGLVAAAGVQGVWLHRAGALAAAAPGERRHFWLAAAMTIVFGYFCLSSFLRANRNNRSSRR